MHSLHDSNTSFIETGSLSWHGVVELHQLPERVTSGVQPALRSFEASGIIIRHSSLNACFLNLDRIYISFWCESAFVPMPNVPSGLQSPTGTMIPAQQIHLVILLILSLSEARATDCTLTAKRFFFYVYVSCPEPFPDNAYWPVR